MFVAVLPKSAWHAGWRADRARLLPSSTRTYSETDSEARARATRGGGAGREFTFCPTGATLERR